MNRIQGAKQIVYLIGLSGAMGGASSVFESAIAVENFLASGLTFPIAAVLTRPGKASGTFGRFDDLRYTVSIAGGPVTEQSLSVNVASGGSGSSQTVLENAVATLLGYLNLNKGPLISSVHGLQGFLVEESRQRTAVGPESAFVVADLEFSVTDATVFSTFHPVFHLSGSSPGSGQVTLSWAPPPARFDTLPNPIIVRYLGTGFPTDPTGGDGSILVPVTGLASGVGPVTTGTGTKYFTVWVAYDEAHAPPSSVTDYSAVANVQVAA